jgi:hypothetical protein
VNWIKRHKSLGKWDCNVNDLNRHVPPAKNDPILVKLGPHYVGCVPCLLKRFFSHYWGPSLLDSAGVPQDLPALNEGIWGLHLLGNRWFCCDPPGLHAELKKSFGDDYLTNTGVADKVFEAKFLARRRNEIDQQDSDEYMRLLLDGCEASYDATYVSPPLPVPI